MAIFTGSAVLLTAGKALLGTLMKKAALVAVKKAAVTAIKGPVLSSIKKRAIGAVKKKAVGAAKNFVTGKGKKRKGKKGVASKGVASKGGALVRSVGGGLSKSGAVGSSFIPKGGALVKSPSGSLSIAAGGSGGTSFEAMSTTLDSIVGLTSQIEKIAESQYKNRKADNQEARKEKDKEKKKNREEQLESKKEKPGSGLLGKVAEKAKGFDLGGFLMNILMGGIALALWKSWDKIQGLFDFLGKKITSFWDMMRYGVITLTTAFRKPTKWIVNTAGKILKKTGKILKQAWKSLDDLFQGGLTKLADGIKNWGKSLWKKVTQIASGGAQQGAKVASRATGVAKRGFKGKAANNIVPGPKNLSKVKPRPKSFFQNITKSIGTKFQKGGLKRLSKVAKVFKRIPVIGALLGIGIDLALGERLDNAIFGALGASLGAWIGGGVGSLILPLLGTLAGAFVGGIIGDWLGKEIYKSMSGQISELTSSKGPQDGDVRYNEKGEREVYSAKKRKWVITPTSTTTPSSNTPRVPTGTLDGLFKAIGRGEGGYNSMNRGDPGDSREGPIHWLGKNLTEMTVAEIMQFQKDGKLHAAGKYQIIPDTMLMFFARGDIKSTDLFDEATQEKFPEYVVNHKRPTVGKYLRGENVPLNDAIYALAAEFASIGVPEDTPAHSLDRIGLPDQPKAFVPKGKTLYAGTNNRAQPGSLEAVAAELQKIRSGGPAQTQITSHGPTTQLTSGVSRLGRKITGSKTNYQPSGHKVSGFEVGDGFLIKDEGGWRNHAGLDILCPEDTYIAFTVPGVVTHSHNKDDPNYGLLMDVYLPSASPPVYMRLAHLNKCLKNAGDQVPAGVPVALSGGRRGNPNAGNSDGPHLHWEANTKADANSSTIDPSRWAKYLILSRKPPEASGQITKSGPTTAVASQTPETGQGPGSQQQAQPQSAQIQPGSSPGQTASSVSSQASYERGGPGGNVVVALPGGGQVQGKVVGGGRQGGGRLIVDPGGILNSYYKAQLLGFLYKQG